MYICMYGWMDGCMHACMQSYLYIYMYLLSYICSACSCIYITISCKKLCSFLIVKDYIYIYRISMKCYSPITTGLGQLYHIYI